MTWLIKVCNRFFDLDNRHEKLNERDPLVMLNKLIDWESFGPALEEIREKRRESNVGRKPNALEV